MKYRTRNFFRVPLFSTRKIEFQLAFCKFASMNFEPCTGDILPLAHKSLTRCERLLCYTKHKSQLTVEFGECKLGSWRLLCPASGTRSEWPSLLYDLLIRRHRVTQVWNIVKLNSQNLDKNFSNQCHTSTGIIYRAYLTTVVYNHQTCTDRQTYKLTNIRI